MAMLIVALQAQKIWLGQWLGYTDMEHCTPHSKRCTHDQEACNSRTTRTFFPIFQGFNFIACLKRLNSSRICRIPFQLDFRNIFPLPAHFLLFSNNVSNLFLFSSWNTSLGSYHQLVLILIKAWDLTEYIESEYDVASPDTLNMNMISHIPSISHSLF